MRACTIVAAFHELLDITLENFRKPLKGVTGHGGNLMLALLKSDIEAPMSQFKHPANIRCFVEEFTFILCAPMPIC